MMLRISPKTWGNHNDHQQIQHIVVFVEKSVRTSSLMSLHSSAVENHWWMQVCLQHLNLVYQSHGNLPCCLRNIVESSHCILMKFVCVCVFMSWKCVWSGNFTKCQWCQSFLHLNPSSHTLSRDKPVFTVSTKCFPDDDHTSNPSDHEDIKS